MIIETDGATHFYEEVKKKDKEKEVNLISHGYSILRLKDTEIVGELEMVKRRIQLWIKEYEKKHPEVKSKNIRNRRS